MSCVTCTYSLHGVIVDILNEVLCYCRVIGLSDGLTVPFALTAGLASLGSSRVVVLGGVAELIAGAISMGIGAFCMYSVFPAKTHF